MAAKFGLCLKECMSIVIQRSKCLAISLTPSSVAYTLYEKDKESNDVLL